MSLEYYMFLEEIRMITSRLDKLQESTNKKVLKTIFFIEDLNTHIKCIDNLLRGG